MEHNDNPKKLFGLLGRNIDYSFSRKYFTERFEKDEQHDFSYVNFDLADISEFPSIIKNNRNLKGLNVTIPYKESVIPFLDKMSVNAEKIGAVNTIKFTKKGYLKGYNTDFYGFKKALKPLLQPHHQKALILGTGGASKGVAFALEQLGILYAFVSRQATENTIDYNRINATTFDNYQIIVNCTPIGTSPDIEKFPDLPYQFFTDKHIAFDLIYNPEETAFLKKAKANGATIKNGYDMLVFQAEKSWKIWNE
ncbi:shikimate 5-dehydrogenase [Flavobacterium noncentrifugens]|uniref:Shikimate dehydrogenase n=1 Tax=Flavobacterium noncentrifugens TaxID=1128970 RepID=A0A1G8VYZ2_9FLAO|nr:shikimate dehydrogenase [Flavobacterium noncentrifugens]GEP50692.1 shikimate 5-dehydrogenase [Flavobacterium noncentrifugens]SDJ70983.1 shikimate dehydrogenase [Flavobacterium noncentrifugens]